MNVVDFYRDRPEYRSMYLNNLYKSAINGLRNGNANPQIIGETGEALCDEGYVTLGSKLMLLALQTSENKLGPYAHLNHSAYINHLYNGTVKTQLWTMAVILVLVILLSIAIMKSHRHKKMLKSIQTFAAEEERRHINEVKDMHKVSAKPALNGLVYRRTAQGVQSICTPQTQSRPGKRPIYGSTIRRIHPVA